MSEQKRVRKLSEPEPTRPRMGSDYGISGSEEGMLSWERVAERMAGARNYWVSTMPPSVRPHATPVWAYGSKGRSTSARAEVRARGVIWRRTRRSPYT